MTFSTYRYLYIFLFSFLFIFSLCSLLLFHFFPLFQAKQLERKEKQLESLSCFYKEQLETMKKKVRTNSHHRHNIFYLFNFFYCPWHCVNGFISCLLLIKPFSLYWYFETPLCEIFCAKKKPKTLQRCRRHYLWDEKKGARLNSGKVAVTKERKKIDRFNSRRR